MRKILLSVLLLLQFFFQANAQEKLVTGTVLGSDDMQPLPGASIKVDGTGLGVVTDINGIFKISVLASSSLIVTYVGYVTQNVKITNQTSYNIVLAANSKTLDDVIVTGYGSQNRKTLTSSVTSVKAEEIANLPSASSDQLLQGRAAGVQVSTNSGAPGGGVFVRIRGTASINGSSDPLYVVDGIPIQAINLSQNGIGGSVTNPIADINPSDIESIDILKDASATAIYGSRAANGVVLITTKRGASGQSKISIGMYTGTQNLIKSPSLVSGEQFETLMNESALNNGRPSPYAMPNLAINTRWNDLVLNDNAPIRNADLSVSGGSDRVKYLLSANNFMQQGVIRNSEYNRSTGRVNLDFNANSKLKIGTSILYSRSNRALVQNDDNISGAFSGSHFYPSNLPVLKPDGTYQRIPTIDHPLATVDEAKISMVTGRFLGTVYAEYEFIPGLRLKSNFSTDYTDNTENSYLNTLTNAGSAVQGSADIYNLNDNNWIQENVLSYQFELDKNSFNVLAGTSLQESETKFIRSIGTGFPTNDFTQISAAAVLRASSSSTSYGIASIFSRVNYDYNKKYLVTLNLRGDASSRFGKDNRWGIFPSVGLGWVLSEENFLKDVSFINSLKLRGGYGITGNQSGIRDFNSLGLWQGAAYSGVPGVRPFQLENPNLKWETTKQTDIGFDVSLFDNRITFNAGYYYKRTEDLLLAVPLPRSSGFQSVVQNLGEIENKGLELGIGADILPQTSQLKWNISGNIAGNRNKVLKLVAPFNVYGRDLFRYQEGFPMYSFYMHKQTGVDPQTGAIQFEDVNGDGKFTSSADRKIVGNANPDFFGGLSNSLNYKGVDLMFMFQFSYGNEQLNWSQFFMQHGGSRATNYSGSQLKRWQKPGDMTNVPKMVATNYASDLRPSRFVEDGSYLRLKNLSLGYKVPAKFASKLRLSSARVYVSGQNVLTFTKYTGLDPEVTATASTNLTQGVEFFTTPSPRVFMSGINVSF